MILSTTLQSLLFLGAEEGFKRCFYFALKKQKLDVQNLNIRYNDTSFWQQNGTKDFPWPERKSDVTVSA